MAHRLIFRVGQFPWLYRCFGCVPRKAVFQGWRIFAARIRGVFQDRVSLFKDRRLIFRILLFLIRGRRLFSGVLLLTDLKRFEGFWRVRILGRRTEIDRELHLFLDRPAQSRRLGGWCFTRTYGSQTCRIAPCPLFGEQCKWALLLLPQPARVKQRCLCYQRLAGCLLLWVEDFLDRLPCRSFGCRLYQFQRL